MSDENTKQLLNEIEALIEKSEEAKAAFESTLEKFNRRAAKLPPEKKAGKAESDRDGT